MDRTRTVRALGSDAGARVRPLGSIVAVVGTGHRIGARAPREPGRARSDELGRFEVSTARWGAVAAGAACAGVAAVADRRALLVLAALTLVLTALQVLPSRPDASSRWWRGWGLVAFAVVPAAVSLATRTGGVVSPGLLLVAGGLVLCGVIGALPSREPARVRELTMEAALGGGLATYLIGAFVPGVSALELAALAVGISAWWLLSLLWVREREQATVAARWMAGAFAIVLLAHGIDTLTPTGGVGEVVAMLLAGPAVVGWAVACCRSELHEQVPSALPPVELLHAGHVRVVVAGVLAGPAAVTVTWALAPGRDLIPLVVAGGTLALMSVLHLLQLVRDHGNRAWRARHDALTGLPSEPLFEDRLERAMVRGRRTGTGFTLAFLDLDGFKGVNDRDGHDAGDSVLRIVADRLREAVREEDTVARRSGDEFLVLLEGLDAAADAELVATKLLDSLRAPIEVGGREHRLGASIGLVRWPRDGADADELMRHADAAMYEAKDRRSGAVRWYSHASSVRSHLRLTLGRQLELAADAGDQFELAFHPRVDLRDGRVVELVTLVRWRHPELGLLWPSSFLPLANEAGLARTVDLAILELAASTVRRWTEDGLLDLPVLVHLADATLGHADLEEEVVGVLRRTGLHAARLGIAVTETALTRAGARGARTIGDLAELGVRTTVSRFGTGTVGVGTLASLPLGGIELAPSLVAGLGDGPAPAALGAALALADRLALTTTASGVGSAEQADGLRAAGCSTARGPYLASPALASTLDRRLRAMRAEAGRPLLAAAVHGDGLPGVERSEIAAVLAAAATSDGEVDEHTLTEVLARLERAARAAPA
jgi:diguanylate cyclase (GGDEF)-like protein